MNLKQIMHTAFLQENSIKAGSAILGGADFRAGKNTILPITVAVSTNLPFVIAEKLARDYQVYVLQMAVQNITGVMINEMEECGIPAGSVVLTESDNARTYKQSKDRNTTNSKVRDYKKDQASGSIGTGAPKNIFTLKPSWTKIEIPVANVETNRETTKTGYREDKYGDSKTSPRKVKTDINYSNDQDAKTTNSLVKNTKTEYTGSGTETSSSTTTSNSGETVTERGTRIGGQVNKMQITLATQAIGFEFSGKHLAYSFLSNLNKTVSEEFDKVYGSSGIVRRIQKMTKSVIKNITDLAYSIASDVDDVILSVTSLFSRSAKQKKFNKRDAAQKIKEALQYANIDWSTIMLHSDDLQGLELTSSIVSNFSSKNKTNILVYDESKRQITMFVQSIRIDKSNKNQTEFAMDKSFDAVTKTSFSAPVIVTYPDSQLGTFRYLNSVEVY